MATRIPVALLKTVLPLSVVAWALAGMPGCDNPGSQGDVIVIVSNASSPFWDAVHRGMIEAGRHLGVNVDLIRNDGTVGGQIRRLEQLRARREVKGVAVSVVEAQAAGIADQMRALREKGVHVISVDSDGPPDVRFAFVGTNNREAGRALGQSARQLLPDGGKAVCFVGIASAQNAQERIEGFQEGAGEKIPLIDTMEDNADESRARTNVVTAIQNHPDVSILAGIWSYNAPAIADEVKASGRREDFTVVTFDAEPNAIRAMEQGLIDVMVVQNPYEMGYQSVRLLHAMIGGDQATVDEMLGGTDHYDTGLKVVVLDESSPIEIPDSETVTKMTLEEFQEWLASKGLESS